MTPEIKQYLSSLGKKGGKTRAAQRTLEQKQADAKHMNDVKKAKKEQALDTQTDSVLQ